MSETQKGTRLPAEVKVEAEGEIGVTQESGFYEAYSGFAKALRTWLIAYGIGAPVIFLTTDTVRENLLGSEVARLVAYQFLAGVAVQILGALLYKSAMWFLYVGEFSAKLKQTRRYRLSGWLSEAFWLELLIDLSTLVLFAWATVLSMEVLL